MKILHAASELQPGLRKVCAAIGVFDGVHLGHQQVIRQACVDAHQHEGLSVVITFDRHPNAVVAPAKNPPLIYSLEQKLRVIGSLGVDAILLLRFDEAFSRITGETFVRDLARDFQTLHSLCVGATFTFGHKRSGNVALLQQLGKELNFTVHGLSAVSLDNRIVSSTRIREAIISGNLYAAGQMLGRPYSVAGRVERGDQLGRQIGFPTANINTTGLALPPNGVYAAHVLHQGQSLRAVLNIGHRPTVNPTISAPKLEVHLLDFAGDIYGEELEIVFVQKLRDEQKFNSLEALKAQIQRDVEAARALF